MAQQAQQIQITTQYGCSETHVLMQHSQPVVHLQLTIEQAEAMRTRLAEAIQALKDRQAGKQPS